MRGHSVEQSAHEGVAHADAVDHGVDVVNPRGVQTSARVERSRDQVVVGAQYAAQSEDNAPAAGEARRNLRRGPFVTRRIGTVGGVAGRKLRQLHAEHLFVFVVRAEEGVALLHQRREHLLRLLAVFPEVLAVVDVARDGQSRRVRRRNRLGAHGRRAGAHRGRNPRPVEPRGAAEDSVPVDHPRLQGVEGRVGAVVYDVRRAHRGGLLHVVNPEPLAAAQDGVRPYAVAAQVVDAGVGHPVVRQAGDEFALQAVVGQRYGDVGLASAVAGAEEVRLVETQVVGRRETQHDLPEGNDLLSVHDFCEIDSTNIHKKPDNRKPDCARFGKGFRQRKARSSDRAFRKKQDDMPALFGMDF